MKGYKMFDFEKDLTVAREIGYFYEKKHNDQKEALSEIRMVDITNIEVNEDVVTISTTRPGILIGKRGSNIEALQKHLKEKLEIKSINIKEDTRACSIRRHLELFSEDFSYLTDDLDVDYLGDDYQ